MQECVKREENTGKHEFEKKQKKTDRVPETRKKKKSGTHHVNVSQVRAP
jgi:hypothetical protein